MPQVPYDPVPQVAAEDQRIQRPQVEAPPAAFGVNIAEGVRQVGATGAQVGDETFRTALWLQNLNNESTARDVSIQATQEMALRAADFDKLEGIERSNALPKYLKDLNDIRIKYRSRLNPVASRMFDAEAASLQNRFTAQGAVSAGAALKQFADEKADGQITLAQRQPVDVWDEKEFQQNQATIDRALESKANIRGWPKEKLDAEKLTAHSTQRFYQVKGQIDSNVIEAGKTLDQAVKDKEIDEKQYDVLHEYLLAKNRSHGSEVIANSIYDPNATLTQLQDRARKVADNPKLNMGDDTFADAVVKAVELKYNQAHHAQIMDRASARTTLDDAVNSGQYRTEADIRGNPTLAQALEQDPSYDPVKALKGYWTNRDNITNEANFRPLARMADTDPQRFLQQDLWEPQMSDSQRGRLIAARKAIIKANGGANADPQVDKASAAIRRIFPNSVPRSGTDDYLVWQGALQGALEDYQAGVQRKLTLDDYEKIGRSLTATAEGSGWWGTTGPMHSAIYDAPVPSDVLDFYRQQGMPDDEIATKYHSALAIQKFKQLFPGVLKGGTEK